jgi:hypothetical protein
MGYIEMIKVSADQLDVCDNCNQQGLKTSGRYMWRNDEYLMWFCFNCKEKM